LVQSKRDYDNVLFQHVSSKNTIPKNNGNKKKLEKPANSLKETDNGELMIVILKKIKGQVEIVRKKFDHENTEHHHFF
jgi:hypothetical protein